MKMILTILSAGTIIFSGCNKEEKKDTQITIQKKENSINKEEKIKIYSLDELNNKFLIANKNNKTTKDALDKLKKVLNNINISIKYEKDYSLKKKLFELKCLTNYQLLRVYFIIGNNKKIENKINELTKTLHFIKDKNIKIEILILIGKYNYIKEESKKGETNLLEALSLFENDKKLLKNKNKMMYTQKLNIYYTLLTIYKDLKNDEKIMRTYKKIISMLKKYKKILVDENEIKNIKEKIELVENDRKLYIEDKELE